MMRRAGSGGWSLFFTLVWVTVGLLILALVIAGRTLLTGHNQLSSLAQETAWSGQAKIERILIDRGEGGYYKGQFTSNHDQVHQVIEAVWQANVGRLSGFQNLSYTEAITDQSITVRVNGTYTPPWIRKALSSVFEGRYQTVVQIPMSVTVSGRASTKNEGGQP